MKRVALARKNRLYKSVLPLNNCKANFSRYFTQKTTFIIAAAFLSLQVLAQQVEKKTISPEYRKTLTERSAKIVNTLGIHDSVKYYRVVESLVNQYADLNSIHDQFKVSVSDIKKQGLSEPDQFQAVKAQEEKKSAQLLQQHSQFIAQLRKDLSNEQLELVKDGMTYRVFPITYTAYQEMLPNLTKEQKDQIYNWLKDARELAMDEGSADDKHKVFGKYKGRINNYLSAAGYDMKKEGEAWQARLKEKENKTKSQN